MDADFGGSGFAAGTVVAGTGSGAHCIALAIVQDYRIRNAVDYRGGNAVAANFLTMTSSSLRSLSFKFEE
jgi:hypothetical protein